MEHRFDRAYYRIVYPLFLRPSLVVGDRRITVADLSEGGIRLLVADPRAFAVGDPVGGVLKLPDDQSLAVNGQVVRVLGSHVALKLSQSIPFAIILDQQRLLQQRILGFR